MGCPLSKVFSVSPRHRRPSTPRNDEYKYHKSTYLSEKCHQKETQEDLQQNEYFHFVNKRRIIIPNHFDFSSQSNFESFITFSISETNLIGNGLKIQLNPYNSNKIIHDRSDAGDIYRLINKENETATIVYNTGIHGKKIFLEEKNLLLLQNFFYRNITAFFTRTNIQRNLTLIIEISLCEIPLDNISLKVEIYHSFNFPNATSITFPIINAEKKLDLISYEAFEPSVEFDFLRRLDSENLSIPKENQKRLLLLDDQFIHIKILLMQLCHEENPHLSKEDKSKLNLFLACKNSKDFEAIWNESLYYIHLSNDFNIYFAKNIENAKAIICCAYPNYIISDQDLGTVEDHLELGTDFFSYVLDQKYTDQIDIKIMLYSANGNEIDVTRRASELKQFPTILEKGKPNLHEKIFIFLNGNNPLSTT